MYWLQNSGVGKEYVFEQDGQFYLKHTQSMDSIRDVLEQNTIERNAGNNGYGETREWRKIASIPVMLDYEFTKKYGKHYLRDPKVLRRILLEHSALRTCDGAL